MTTEQFRSRRMEETIRYIDKSISSCILGEGIIREAFLLGWNLREYAAFKDIPLTSEEAERIYSLDKKIREHCKCTKI